MFWAPLAMAAMGGIMGKQKNDRAQAIESDDRKLAAETQRYSPWTRMQANPIRRAGSQFGDIFGGAVNGAMMGQSLGNGFGGMGGEGIATAGGYGTGVQEAAQTMSPWEKLLQQSKTMQS